jgi:hypothetical protein
MLPDASIPTRRGYRKLIVFFDTAGMGDLLHADGRQAG